ncbi:MAG: glycosyltransferase [Acidobacteriota bacterium]|nr:glycosyltransferase [Acidobacteriota bacterium]
MRAHITNRDALLMRVGSPLAALLEPLRRPFGLEVVGDPYEVFAPGSIEHPFRPALRLLSTTQLRSQCKRASAVSFVTESALQSRYPADANAFVTSYSSIELHDSDFVFKPRIYGEFKRPLRLVSVGSFEQPYKGFDTLIDAAAACTREGMSLELVLVGDGKYRASMEQRASDQGLQDRVRFTGLLPSGDRVRQELDRADLFVLASKTEGLPRAMVEAMAQALPCLGSAVGGIPELLPAEHLFPRGNDSALAQHIQTFLSSPALLTCASQQNLIKAQCHHHSILDKRRRAFLEHLRRATEGWLSSITRTQEDYLFK